MEQLHGYDNWLERPFQKRCDEEAKFEAWMEENEEELLEDLEEIIILDGTLDDDVAGEVERRFSDYAEKEWERRGRP